MPPQILIVDDDSTNLKFAAEVLEREGNIVSKAADAAHAVRQILAHRPDLILMGSALRGMDGLTLTMHLKSDPATSDIRIVALTESASKRDTEEAAAAGCDGYIGRPIDPWKLNAQVTRFLRSAVRTQESDVRHRQEPKILVVDDNELNREVLRAVLDANGYSTSVAADGGEALSLLERESIDAIISDIMMPSLDGYQLCHEIRRHGRFDDVPVILYSAICTSPTSQMLAEELGAVRFLRKPAPMDTIVGTLCEVMSEARSRKAQKARVEMLSLDPGETARLIETQNKKLHDATDRLLQLNHEMLVLTRALEESEERLREKNAQLEDDIRIAREMQRALLPHRHTSFPLGMPPHESALHFHQRYDPTGSIGGDFFDVRVVSATEAGVFICDVMGHGVRAALVASLIRGLTERLAPHSSDPSKLLSEINCALAAILRYTDSQMFASAFYMIADASTGEIRYSNAGHPSPFLVRRDTGAIERLGVHGRSHGPALGLLEDSVYPTGHRMLSPRDMVVLFTDGIFGVDGPGDEQFGEKRLLHAVHDRIDLPADQLLKELVEEVQRFSGTDEFADDICLIGMELAHLCKSSGRLVTQSARSNVSSPQRTSQS